MARALLIPVKYGKKSYPPSIKPGIQEVAGHLDVPCIRPAMPYSLHTEYCYGARKFDSLIVARSPEIRKAHKNGIPQLWINRKWSLEFAEFVAALVGDNQPPRVIEIHPTFDDYCPSIELFLDHYSVFERRIGELFPDAIICLEHRFGTTYKGGKFLIAAIGDILRLTSRLQKENLNLQIVLDFVQLFTRHFGARPKQPRDIDQVFNLLQSCTDRISSVHIWGRREFGEADCTPGGFKRLLRKQLRVKESFPGRISPASG